MEKQQAGPRKVIDFKLDENGKQFYKVKWEPTWEPAENLSAHQHLLDEFWAFANNVKKTKHAAAEQLTQGTMSIFNEDNQMALQKLSPEEILGTEELIKRTMSTSVGKEFIFTPRYELKIDAPVAPPMLLSPPQTPAKLERHSSVQAQQQEWPSAYRFPLSPSGNVSNPVINKPNFGEDALVSSMMTPLNAAFAPTKQENTPKVGRQPKVETPGKQSVNVDGGVSNAACLKYIQNFSHPHVKLNIVCIICNKEASKFPRNWKRHYVSCSIEKTMKKDVESMPPVQKKKRPKKIPSIPVKAEEYPIKEEM